MEYLEDLTINHDDYLVIVTRGHQYDYEILKQVIKSKARYIGMIGSTHKRNQIYKKLQSGDGIKKNYINRVFSPIGLDIGSETPAEIAIAIAAELVKIRRAGPGGDLDG